MLYECNNCRREFEFNDIIEYCPYCGKALEGSTPGQIGTGSCVDIVQAIDSIWGDSARIRNEFYSVISTCIALINSYTHNSVDKILPNQELSKYEKHYASIKQSNNRKTLITRIESFLDYLDIVIDNLNDSIPSDTGRHLEDAVVKSADAVKELYDFLGMRYVPYSIDFLSKETYSAKILYTREQIRLLYNLVIVAYSKYKKCVEDNNMFAAFASSSNYGTMPDYWHRWMSKLSSEDEDEICEKEDPRFDQVVEYLKKHNAENYYGLLDEDFVPHVDAFWYGLEMLCEFIDHHVAVECDLECLCLDDDERSKILRRIKSQEYYVNEAKLESAIEFKKHLEVQNRALNKN